MTLELEAELTAIAQDWVSRLNGGLNAAQTGRGQPVEDGYTFELVRHNDRSVIQIIAFTARAQAHEAKNSSILKLMRTSGHSVEAKGGEFKNPTKGFAARRV